MVLELARHPQKGASAGVTFRAVSAVHGDLFPQGEPASVGEIVTHVQAHHAELDSDGDGALLSLEKELKSGTKGNDVQWQTLKYAHCVHGWSGPPGVSRYRAAEAVRAHKSSVAFFEEARKGFVVEEDFPGLSFSCAQPPAGDLLVVSPSDWSVLGNWNKFVAFYLVAVAGLAIVVMAIARNVGFLGLRLGERASAHQRLDELRNFS